ncbi:MAG: ESPR-type extended signal peptide-containing protein [Rubrivivax sp.]
MNAQVHSLKFDRRRQMCVAVAESVSHCGKAASGEGADGMDVSAVRRDATEG